MSLIIALVAGGLGAGGTYLLTGGGGGTDTGYSLDQSESSGKNRDRPPESIAGMAGKVLPSVVSIKAGSATGSGFLIKKGYIVTNNHVVAGVLDGGDIEIQFDEGQTTSAKIVGKPAAYADLAVLKPQKTFSKPELRIGNSDDLRVGDPVTAIGSPLGLPGTVTTGIVSALNRPVVAGKGNEERSFIDAVQTDAAINPGNSGGPLVNAQGELVGVNSVIASLGGSEIPGQERQSGSIGLGFAIPANQTRSVVELIITKGEARRPILGVLIDDAFEGPGGRIASSPVDGREPVSKGSPADEAGLKPSDIITKINGKGVKNFEALQVMLANYKPGDQVTITYLRGGKTTDTKVKLEAE